MKNIVFMCIVTLKSNSAAYIVKFGIKAYNLRFNSKTFHFLCAPLP